ncbi:MAG: glycosyltransferase [Armatimonadetes bacterium]|nr:glycosyltransferase [Armatimonadota bacterium]
MKIALIGPAFPLRGGIAHHTNMLAIYLRKHGHAVDVITFRRQYPKILYPGRFQEEIGDGGGFAQQVQSERLIDSMSLGNWKQVGALLHQRNYDLIAFKYWTPMLAPAFSSIAKRAHHEGRKDIMVIVDNLFPHERRPIDRLLTDKFFRYCNLALTQSSTVYHQLARAYPAIPQRLTPHPMYENFGAKLDTHQARKQLGIDSPKVLLFFGFVRQYKGLDRLLSAMPEIARRHPDAQLYVVGEFFGGEKKKQPYIQQIEQGGVRDNITVVDRYVPNDEVALWFSAADMLVQPYHSATNSGIVQIAYNFATPLIVTNVGSLGEVVVDGHTGFVIDDPSPNGIADAVDKMYHNGTIQQFSHNITQERKKYSWDAFVEGMLEHARTVQQQ